MLLDVSFIAKVKKQENKYAHIRDVVLLITSLLIVAQACNIFCDEGANMLQYQGFINAL